MLILGSFAAGLYEACYVLLPTFLTLSHHFFFSKAEGEEEMYLFFCCSYDFPMDDKESAMQCCQATTKGTANTVEWGNIFCSFNYDQKSLALLIVWLVSFLLRLAVKALSISCIENITWINKVFYLIA